MKQYSFEHPQTKQNIRIPLADTRFDDEAIAHLLWKKGFKVFEKQYSISKAGFERPNEYKSSRSLSHPNNTGVAILKDLLDNNLELMNRILGIEPKEAPEKKMEEKPMKEKISSEKTLVQLWCKRG